MASWTFLNPLRRAYAQLRGRKIDLRRAPTTAERIGITKTNKHGLLQTIADGFLRVVKGSSKTERTIVKQTTEKQRAYWQRGKVPSPSSTYTTQSGDTLIRYNNITKAQLLKLKKKHLGKQFHIVMSIPPTDKYKPKDDDYGHKADSNYWPMEELDEVVESLDDENDVSAWSVTVR